MITQKPIPSFIKYVKENLTEAAAYKSPEREIKNEAVMNLADVEYGMFIDPIITFIPEIGIPEKVIAEVSPGDFEIDYYPEPLKIERSPGILVRRQYDVSLDYTGKEEKDGKYYMYFNIIATQVSPEERQEAIKKYKEEEIKRYAHIKYAEEGKGEKFLWEDPRWLGGKKK